MFERYDESEDTETAGEIVMGCDIHTYVERQEADGAWHRVEWPTADKGPFDDRDYSVFGWLANVRNYSEVATLAEPRGLPNDASAEVRREWDGWSGDGHSCSWFTVDELAGFNYEGAFEDRRVTRDGDGGVTADPGAGEVVTYREFLGPSYFRDLATLTALGQVHRQGPTRVVFWFDN